MTMDRIKNNKKIIQTSCFFLMIVLYLFFCSFHISDTFMDDETWEFYASKTLLEKGRALTVTGSTNVYHPHGYYYIMGLSFRLFGVNETASRIIGLISTILVFLIMLRIVSKLGNGWNLTTCFLLGVFYLLSPAVIQGSMIITADTGVHHLLIMLFLLYMVEKYPFNKIDYFILAILFALCLWIKIVTPCAVIFSCVFYFVIKREWTKAAGFLFIVSGIGFLLFLLPWYCYCRGINEDFTIVFKYIFGVLLSRKEIPSVSAKIISVLRSTLVIFLWFGIPYVVLILYSIWNFRKYLFLQKEKSAASLLLFVALLVSAAYALVAGIAFGYPRYHFTMLPIWAIVVTLCCEPVLRDHKLPLPFAIISCAILCLYFFFAVGDPLYAINFELKLWKLALQGLSHKSLSWFGMKFAVLLLPIIILFIISLKRKSLSLGVSLLILLVIATNISQNCVQALAKYQTNLSYGESGTSEVIKYCSQHIEKGKTILAGKDIVYHVLDRGYIDDYRWNEDDYILNKIKDVNNQFVIMGINHNTVIQLYKLIKYKNKITEILNQQYYRKKIGSYFIWERK